MQEFFDFLGWLLELLSSRFLSGNWFILNRLSRVVGPCGPAGGVSLAAEIVKINAETPDMRMISYVADRIKAGLVVGMPTDTFYGLAADPLNLRAVDLIYDVKSRSRHKPLSLLIESVEQAEYLARPLPDVFYAITRKYWPGPLTIIVKASSRLPLKVTANTGNVALRVPAARIPVEIIRAAGVPVTATSANISGASECTTADGVRQQLGGRISLIVDGGTSPRDVASTIIDMSVRDKVIILRQGAIPESELAEFLN
jgi:L-threonylcarbamoyladenylate synthase